MGTLYVCDKNVTGVHLTSVVNESQPKIALKLMLLLFTKKDIDGVN